MQLADLGHQLLVDREPAGRVDEEHVEVVALRMVEGRGGDGERRIGRARREPLGTRLARHRLQLFDGGRAVHVGRDGEHLLASPLDQVLGQLGRGRGLAGALQAGHQDDRRRLRGEVELGDAIAHGRCELAADDADQRLARRQRAHDLGAERALLHPGDEVADDRQRHIRLEERDAHFAHHVLDVVFGDARLATHRLDEAAQPIGECRCHPTCAPSFRARVRKYT